MEKRALFAGALALGCVLPAAAQATHLSLPQSGSRPALGADEGYLDYAADPVAARFGDEWTGWLDGRHPALQGPRDPEFGYDRSDHFVGVQTTTLTGAGGGPALPNIPRDFDVANRAFVLQGGLSIVETAHRDVSSGAAAAFTFPLDVAEEMGITASLNAGAPTLDVYYGTSLDSNAFGETIAPSQGLGAPAVFVADSQAAPPPLPPIPVRPDTFAHEIAHFATDARAIHDENPTPDQPHSADAFNLLAGANRQIPSGGGLGLLEIGPPLSLTPGGPVLAGGKDQLTTIPDDPAGTFPANASQIERIFSSAGAGNGAAPFVQTQDRDAAGHRVDWDFVTDHLALEGIANRADNHPGPDSLYFEIGFTTPADHGAHDHADWEAFSVLGDYAGPFFRTVDVFSLDLRYSDQDVGPFGVSPIEVRLDYDVLFRAADGSTAPGIPVAFFELGWTDSSMADAVVRWLSPIDAVGVFVFAHDGDGHDGIAQIDAVIASQVPEPATALLLLLGIAGLAAVRRAGARV